MSDPIDPAPPLVSADRAKEINDVAQYNAGLFITHRLAALKGMGAAKPGSRLGLSAVPGSFTDDEVDALRERIRQIGQALKGTRI